MTKIVRKPGVVCLVIRALLLLIGFVVVVVVLFVPAIVFPLSKSGKVKDEAMIAGRTAESMPAADELLSRYGRWHPTHLRSDEGTQQLDCVDRRKRPVLGLDLGEECWKSGLPQDHLFVSGTSGDTRQPLEVSRTGERAVLREGHRPRS